MSVDMTKVLLKDDRAALKIVDVKTGSIQNPSVGANTISQNEQSFAHGLGNDNVIVFLSAKWSNNNHYVTAPFSTSDSRFKLHVSFDSANVYVTAISSGTASGVPATTFDYTLFIAVP